MSRQDIADYFGLAIEPVSCTFTRLERHGAIEIIHRGISLLDPAKPGCGLMPDAASRCPPQVLFMVSS